MFFHFDIDPFFLLQLINMLIESTKKNYLLLIMNIFVFIIIILIWNIWILPQLKP